MRPNYPVWSDHARQTGSGSYTLTVPDGARRGDILLFIVGTRNSSIGAAPTPGDWRRLFRYDSGSAEMHGGWWMQAAEGDKRTSTLTQSGTGAAILYVVRPLCPVGEPSKAGGRWSKTIPAVVAPRGALCLDLIVGSYSVSHVVRWSEGWDLGTVKQSNDEGVGLAWRPSYGGLHGTNSPVDGGGTSQYWAAYSLVFPPVADTGPDTEARA